MGVPRKFNIDKKQLTIDLWGSPDPYRPDPEKWLTIRQIAAKYNVAKDTINKRLAEYGIPVKSIWFQPVPSRRKWR